MKTRPFKLTVSFIILALSGIVFTQVYWVKNAMELKDEQFSHSVRIALKSVVNRLMLNASDKSTDLKALCAPGCITDTATLFRLIGPEELDMLIREELSEFRIGIDYGYGIYRNGSGEVLLNSPGVTRPELLNSEHSASLSCLFTTDPLYLTVVFRHERTLAYQGMALWVVLSLLFILSAFGGFTYIMQHWRRQKQLSEIKTDFINNMTHEFRTPIATISLASEMLQKLEVVSEEARVVKYASIIHNENTRLQGQVERILQIAVIDKGEFKIRPKTFDANDVLKNLLRGFEITVGKRGGKIRSCFEAKKTVLVADRVHFTNIIANLLDNANKYSPEAPDILLHTSNTSEGLSIMIRDRGIGISRENHDHVFRNLYRVPTGNLHDVKGFGLGLYYVKRMTEAHGGHVKLESEPGKGSTFYVFFPFGKESDTTE